MSGELSLGFAPIMIMLCPSFVLVQGTQQVGQMFAIMCATLIVHVNAATRMTSSHQQQTDDPRMPLSYSGVASIALARCCCEFCYLGSGARGRCLVPADRPGCPSREERKRIILLGRPNAFSSALLLHTTEACIIACNSRFDLVPSSILHGKLSDLPSTL